MKKSRNHTAKLSPKLTDAEAERLGKFISENNGQTEAGDLLGVTSFTLSRTLNRRTAPSTLLRRELVRVGVVVKKK